MKIPRLYWMFQVKSRPRAWYHSIVGGTQTPSSYTRNIPRKQFSDRFAGTLQCRSHRSPENYLLVTYRMLQFRLLICTIIPWGAGSRAEQLYTSLSVNLIAREETQTPCLFPSKHPCFSRICGVLYVLFCFQCRRRCGVHAEQWLRRAPSAHRHEVRGGNLLDPGGSCRNDAAEIFPCANVFCYFSRFWESLG